MGDDLAAPGGKLTLRVRVQCPNWIEVNRVQVFVNGQPEPKCELHRSARTADSFTQRRVVFDEKIPHRAGRRRPPGRGLHRRGQGAGPRDGAGHGKDMPVAVGNPIFVDVDGGGFKPNGDMLGLPLVLEPGEKPSKGHKHPHPH